MALYFLYSELRRAPHLTWQEGFARVSAPKHTLCRPVYWMLPWKTCVVVHRQPQQLQQTTPYGCNIAAQQRFDAWLRNTSATYGVRRYTHHQLSEERCELSHTVPTAPTGWSTRPPMSTRLSAGWCSYVASHIVAPMWRSQLCGEKGIHGHFTVLLGQVSPQ